MQPEERRLFFIQLNENFFKTNESILLIQDSVSGVERILFISIYLQLILASLRNDGVIKNTFRTATIPPKVLKAKIGFSTGNLSSDLDTVQKAIALFEELELIKITRDGSIYVPGAKMLAMSKSEKSQYRLEQRRANKLVESEALGKNISDNEKLNGVIDSAFEHFQKCGFLNNDERSICEAALTKIFNQLCSDDLDLDDLAYCCKVIAREFDPIKLQAIKNKAGWLVGALTKKITGWQALNNPENKKLKDVARVYELDHLIEPKELDQLVQVFLDFPQYNDQDFLKAEELIKACLENRKEPVIKRVAFIRKIFENNLNDFLTENSDPDEIRKKIEILNCKWTD